MASGTLCFQHGASPEARSEAGRRGALVLHAKRVERRLDRAQGALAGALPAGDGRFATAAATRASMEQAASRLERGELAPSQVLALAALARLSVDIAKLELDRDTLEELKQARLAQAGGRRRSRR